MLKTTPFHERASALCVSHAWRRWAGFLVASSYELSHEREYHAIRAAAGLLDISPLYKYLVKGPDAARFLDLVVTRSIQSLGVGQVAYTPEGGAAHPGDFKAQARAALQCLKAQVEAGGGTMADIVKVNTYLTDIRHRADYGPIREEFFGKKMPAHTLVAVAALAQPEFLIEIEAVAVIDPM